MSPEKTIAAIATPPGIGGVCVIRISGPISLAIAEALSGKVPQPRQATLCHFRDTDGEVVDQGLLLYFKAPHSFTGEDVVELQGHGGMAVAQGLLQAALNAGAVMAEPGEFSRRAFLNDKMDLAQAEAVADLISARSQAAVRAANRSLKGVFSDKVEALAAELLKLRVYIEAALDFPEEEIDFIREGDIEGRLLAWGAALGGVIAQARQGQLVNEGIDLVLAGKPNAGKSSLLNALLGEERAIVTEQAGTTRDIVRESILINGMPVNVLDTAGLRESEDIVEREGVRRSHAAIAAADVVLLLIDGRSVIDSEEMRALAQLRERLSQSAPQAHFLTLYNKADLVDDEAQAAHADGVWLSAKTGVGLEAVKAEIARVVGRDAREETPFIARERHLRALILAETYYRQAMAQLQGYGAAELVADDLRLAHDALGEITGKVHPDALLGEIFSGFCIGK